MLGYIIIIFSPQQSCMVFWNTIIEVAFRIGILFTCLPCIYYMDDSTKQNTEDFVLEAPLQSDVQWYNYLCHSFSFHVTWQCHTKLTSNSLHPGGSNAILWSSTSLVSSTVDKRLL